VDLRLTGVTLQDLAAVSPQGGLGRFLKKGGASSRREDVSDLARSNKQPKRGDGRGV